MLRRNTVWGTVELEFNGLRALKKQCRSLHAGGWPVPGTGVRHPDLTSSAAVSTMYWGSSRASSPARFPSCLS